MERLAAVITWAELHGRDKGLRGPSSVWMAIWVLTVSYRQLKRWTGPDPIVVREVLRPGEQLVVTHFPKGSEPPEPPHSRRARRRAGTDS